SIKDKEKPEEKQPEKKPEIKKPQIREIKKSEKPATQLAVAETAPAKTDTAEEHPAQVVNIETLYGPPPPFEPSAYPEVLEEKFTVFNYNDKFGRAPYGFVMVQPEETLSHFSDWLLIPKYRIKQWNHTRRNYVYINQKIKLYFTKVSRDDFEAKRIEYHKELYEDFFANYYIKDFEEHKLEKNETLWSISQDYNVPLWLLYVYNQQMDFKAIVKGDKIKVPIIEARTVDTTEQSTGF
ncbi:MAG: LysM peptidoglycan-binding domain-containing protein, partial [Oligoflexia bacterium]|nr:LysM peptidoglycan-binding domain-containing protein [Oligoflexia bacterium]